MQFQLKHLLIFVTLIGIAIGAWKPIANIVDEFMFRGVCRGCPSLQPCEGVVTLDGVPLPNAKIRFANRYKLCEGQADSNGCFTMRTGQGAILYDGLLIGTYYVSVGPPESPETDVFQIGLLVPQHYQSLKTSCLMVEVPEGGFSDYQMKLESLQ